MMYQLTNFGFGGGLQKIKFLNLLAFIKQLELYFLQNDEL